MNILIASKGSSRRIPKKNLQTVRGMPLLGWCIAKAKWFPSAGKFVATEDPEMSKYAKRHGCDIHPLNEDDISDRRTMWSMAAEFAEIHPERPLVILTPCHPFVFKRSIIECLERDDVDLIRTGRTEALHTFETGPTLSQYIKPTTVLNGAILVLHGRHMPAIETHRDIHSINTIEGFNIDTPEELKFAKWLGTFISPNDFER